MGCIRLLAFFSLSAGLYAQSNPGTLQVHVKDSSGGAIVSASVTLRNKASGQELTASKGSSGTYSFAEVRQGDYVLTAAANGFSPVRRDVRAGTDDLAIELQLHPATIASEVFVSAGQIVGTPFELQRTPGSVGLVSAAQLTQSRVFTTDEALRKVAGVNTRGEEGFGLRPNIGIRGLSPTRSTRVLLLEDGLPLSYAPYGDNASYYHPPIDRFQEIEVLKGAGQILYGPMTVGGVVNYITPSIPSRNSGSAAITGGTRDYLNGHLQYGFNWKRIGFLFDTSRKQGEGARDNNRHGLSDVNLKTLTTLTAKQSLGARFNYYKEDSQVTYSGLRQSEWDMFGPRYNPFLNDHFNGDRLGLSVNHTWALHDDFVVSTNAYGYQFERNWWRQSSNSGQRPNDSADLNCGGMANLFTTCGNEGRLRNYRTWGIEPKARAGHRWLGVRSESDFGFRYHDELQERTQQNGALPTSRTGLMVENNQRIARAASGFLQNRLILGRWSITPGVRIENVRFQRTNRLLAVQGATALTQAIPGIGVAYGTSRFTFFTGLHRGFAPPRVEDVVSNTTGASIELAAELSWNYEAGMRAYVNRDLSFEATFFRMDFQNQIVPASVAGGVGAVLTNGGQTMHEGVEFAGRYARRNLFGTRHGVWLQGAYTYLPVARFDGLRYSAIGGFNGVLITGNRLPYAPRNLLNASVGYTHASGVNALLEANYTDAQFGDDLNARIGTADGQRGLIGGNTVWNGTFNYPVERWHTTLFVTAKNVFDRVYIADRTRGLLPGSPRLLQVGFRFTF